MALTIEQIARRRFSIGSSDAPSVCGVNPWRSAYDVWLEKTGRVEPFAGNDATKAGDLLERPIIQYAFNTLQPVHANLGVELVSAEYEFLTATLDAEFVFDADDRCIVEGKSAGICSPLNSDWGDPETDEIPGHYMIQVQHQMYAAGPEYQFVAVAALIPPRGFVMYYVPRDEQLIAAIVGREIEFWRCVQADTPPDGSPSMDAIKRRHREPNKIVEIDPGIVAAYREAQERAKAAEKEADEIKAALLASLGDAEAGIAGGEMITYYESSRKGYFVEPTTYRQLRFKKGKV